jgi:hypothetical protein
MKLQVTRIWRRQISNTKVRTIKPGVYRVPDEVSEDDAMRIVQMHAGSFVAEPAKKKMAAKKAPENKVVESPENKAGVAKPAKRGRSARPKS